MNCRMMKKESETGPPCNTFYLILRKLSQITVKMPGAYELLSTMNCSFNIADHVLSRWNILFSGLSYNSEALIDPCTATVPSIDFKEPKQSVITMQSR